VVHEGEIAVVALDHLAVYPNGFTVNVVILVNPHQPNQSWGALVGTRDDHLPRIGVRFSDGRTGGRLTRFNPMATAPAKDEQGLPIEPFVSFAGGGGGGGAGWRFIAWVYPLPPDGPLEIFIGLPAAGLEEASVTVDGSAVRAAAERAKVIWS
jgi:hypothetical protein